MPLNWRIGATFLCEGRVILGPWDGSPGIVKSGVEIKRIMKGMFKKVEETSLAEIEALQWKKSQRQSSKDRFAKLWQTSTRQRNLNSILEIKGEPTMASEIE